MTATIRSRQIESTVRAALRAGLRRVRVEIDPDRGSIVLEGATDDEPPQQPRSFDLIDFRAAR